MLKRARAKGQAVVEFALAATLIFFLLSAAVDLGLLFFTYQGLHNAAEEGASYGSRWLTSSFQLDYDGIRDRARHEAGTSGIGFANLLDLNADGIPDTDAVVKDYIQVRAIFDANGNGTPYDDGTAPNYTACPSLSNPAIHCHLQVIVSADYHFLFPLAPAFGDQIRLNSPFLIEMRNH